MSSSGALDSAATCSTRSIIRLNASLRVAMPDFRKDAACAFSAAKRVAILSYRERSRSMTP
jgi:hypothetical protein